MCNYSNLAAVIPPVWIAEFRLMVIIYRILKNGSEATDCFRGRSLLDRPRADEKIYLLIPEKSPLGIDTGLSFKEETRISDGGYPSLVAHHWPLDIAPQQISKEQKLKTNQTIITILLSVWTSRPCCSFVFVFTARRVVGRKSQQLRQPPGQHDMNAPFLAVRFYLLVKYAIVSETSVFLSGEEQTCSLCSSCTGFTRSLSNGELNGARIASSITRRLELYLPPGNADSNGPPAVPILQLWFAMARG
uniref:Uncharacterized protein n=1 Tax=Macrostomum lignano TaxID=282301 RepID=A0A1I8JNT2_9PLAT